MTTERPIRLTQFASGGLLLCLDAGVAGKAVADLEAAGHQAADVGVLEVPTADRPIGRISLRP